MKITKRVFAIFMTLALAMSMMITMSAVSFADTKVSMTIESTDSHQYKVYQIFTGDLSGTTLSNVVYGKNYGTTGNKVPQNVLDGIENADSFARSIVSDLHDDPVGTLTKDNQSITVDKAGYYLIIDDTSIKLDDGDAYSAYIVKVVGDVTLTPKKDTTSVDKKITTDTLGKDDATTTVNGKVDNVSIGDVVNYEITGTVPAHATDYDYYFYIIGDTLTAGLTFDPESVVVKVAATAEEEESILDKDDDYALYTGTDADGKTFQVALTDAKSLAGRTIIVTYSATLNENAVVGELSNDNTVTIEYSNNPNHDYDGDKDENKPGKPADKEKTPLGETPESKTRTFTTQIQIQKVDENGDVLTGAEFTLTGDNEEIVLVSSEEFTEATDGTYYKLTNGNYTTQDPITEDYMEEADAGATAGYVEDATYTGEDKVVIGEKTYRPYKADTDAGKKVYIHVKANTDKYDSTETKYKKTVTYTQKNTNTSGVTATAEVGADGVVIFRGLGSGSYTISETKTPAGYNTIADMTIDISFTANPAEGSYHWNTSSEDARYNPETGGFEVTIENQKGSELPETGGIGTMIFYVLGTLLVVGCGIVLISKRRMENR